MILPHHQISALIRVQSRFFVSITRPSSNSPEPTLKGLEGSTFITLILLPVWLANVSAISMPSQSLLYPSSTLTFLNGSRSRGLSSSGQDTISFDLALMDAMGPAISRRPWWHSAESHCSRPRPQRSLLHQTTRPHGARDSDGADPYPFQERRRMAELATKPDSNPLLPPPACVVSSSPPGAREAYEVTRQYHYARPCQGPSGGRAGAHRDPVAPLPDKKRARVKGQLDAFHPGWR